MKQLIGKYRNGIRYEDKLKLDARMMRQNGFTHREISAKLAVSTSTAHLWTADISLTKEQKVAIEKRRHKPVLTPEIRAVFRKRAYKNLKKFWIKNTYSKKELLEKIIHFYEKERRIPLKREFNMYRVYKNAFGSWNEAIRAAGFSPNEVIFSKKFRSLDGHPCDSFAEMIIDDFLSKNNIDHLRNISYPGTKMTADFAVKDLFIEYFGLEGVSANYNHLIEQKRKVCKKENINLLEIHPPALFAKNFEPFFLRVLTKSIGPERLAEFTL